MLYELDESAERERRIRIDGSSVLVHESDLNNVVFLRLDAGIEQDKVEALSMQIKSGGLGSKVVILPNYVRLVKVSPTVPLPRNDRKVDDCPKCGHKMRDYSSSMICPACGYEKIRDGILAF
jgi:predicted RNA-binding Zn-ribbon protein involved in translation (DUF1610 family)